jgi:CRISPR/Cas system-associated endonuclease/helicase Cas3
VIYDSLKQIQVDTSDLQAWRKSIGISDKIFLRDNSIDSQRLDADDAGRRHAMEGKKLIVATSTVEVGITLDGLNLLIMEPGFNLMSFLQRIGRAGRKGENAHIVVCVNDKKIANNPWLSELIQFVKRSDGRLSILEVTKFLQGQSGSTLENTYGELSLRGSYCAAQYWNILTENLENHKEKSIFQEKRPTLSRQMWAMLNKIEDKKWIKRFNKEMVNLRNFPPSVTVTGIKKESAEFNVSIPWLFKHTDILETYSLHVGTKNYIYLEGDKDWVDFINVIKNVENEAKPEGYKRTAWMPLSSSVLIGVYDPLEDYKKRCIKKQNPEDRRRFEAASTLVGLTGVIPYDDGVSDVGSNTAVF